MAPDWQSISGEMLEGRFKLDTPYRTSSDRAAFGAHLPDTGPLNAELAAVEGAEREQLRRQWQAAANLHHPHLAPILAAGEAEIQGRVYLFRVEERPDDCLAEALATRRLTEEEARQTLTAVLRGLEFLHARGFAHGAVDAEHIIARGDDIQLRTDRIKDAATASDQARDMEDLGRLIPRMLGQPETIPAPLSRVSEGCLRENDRLTPTRALALLNQPSQPMRKPAIIAAAAVALLLLAILLVRPRKAERDDPAAIANANRLPSPVGIIERVEASRTKAATTMAPVELPKGEAPAEDDKSTDWAVIAATYNDYDGAQKRADELRSQMRNCVCSVYPPRGEGSKYYVVLGSGFRRPQAYAVRERALVSGLPSDTYVTRMVPDQERARSTTGENR